MSPGAWQAGKIPGGEWRADQEGIQRLPDAGGKHPEEHRHVASYCQCTRYLILSHTYTNGILYKTYKTGLHFYLFFINLIDCFCKNLNFYNMCYNYLCMNSFYWNKLDSVCYLDVKYENSEHFCKLILPSTFSLWVEASGSLMDPPIWDLITR